jgi:L-lactate dehydrogenase complex protein LldG
MSHKQAILDKLRKHAPADVPHPGVAGPWTSFEDRMAQFRSMVEAVGGKCVSADDRFAVNRLLLESEAYTKAKKIFSAVEGVGTPTFDLGKVDDPHDLHDVDFAIYRGEFGVAENGAVWVTDEGLPHRVIYFIPQHVAIVLGGNGEPADCLVSQMYEAYQRISFDSPRFGLFISGPSKTADIEQSLVIGAHGPRSLTVYLVRDNA